MTKHQIPKYVEYVFFPLNGNKQAKFSAVFSVWHIFNKLFLCVAGWLEKGSQWHCLYLHKFPLSYSALAAVHCSKQRACK